jgi:hypothetical protein
MVSNRPDRKRPICSIARRVAGFTPRFLHARIASGELSMATTCIRFFCFKAERISFRPHDRLS